MDNLSSHQVREATFTRNIETQMDSVSFKQGDTREKVGLVCDQYRFRDDDTINYATISQL